MLDILPPDQLFGPLFTDVQQGDIFEDSKTFVDAIPKDDPEAILAAYRLRRGQKLFNLKSFVMDNFDLPPLEPATSSCGVIPPLRQRLEQIWDTLSREADKPAAHSSLISLPAPYLVPGGRFREIYYWDSYFTMLGLRASGRTTQIENMVINFAHLIDRIGFIPNGNRTYYCTRSQPPYFALMVEMLAQAREDTGVYLRFLPQMAKEYGFWMQGAERLSAGSPVNRRVIAVDGGFLNRYWDDTDRPRQESYREDLALAAATERTAAGLYRDIRATCESGWDFSSRWFADDGSLGSTRTSQVVPIDLNTLLFKLEAVLAMASQLAGDGPGEKFYRQRADSRAQLIGSLFFDCDSGFFYDLLLPDLCRTRIPTLAAAYPLFLQLADDAQAKQVVARLQADFLKPGGWVTTLNDSGQQWDAPNGWAPLQWIAYSGMVNYGFDGEAREGARRWVGNNIRLYEQTGRFMEKYNVVEIEAPAGGGEYQLQDGFGWTNGVLLKLMGDLGFPVGERV